MVFVHCPCDTVVRMRGDDDGYNLVEGKGAWVACFHHAFSLICNTVYSNKDRNVSAFVAVFWGSKVFIFWWEDISNKFWSGSVSRLVSIFVVQLFHLVQSFVIGSQISRRSIVQSEARAVSTVRSQRWPRVLMASFVIASLEQVGHQ